MRTNRWNSLVLGLGVSISYTVAGSSTGQELGVATFPAAITVASQEQPARESQVFELGPIQGAAEPKSALQYLFTIDPIHPVDGNAAVHYLDAVVSLDAAAARLEEPAKRWEYDWLGEVVVPIEELETFLEATQRTRESIQRGAACSYCDFGSDWSNRTSIGELVEMNLETHQRMRRLMRYLMLEIRYAYRTGDHERAARGMTCLFEIAHDVKRPELLVTGLIGTAGNGIALALCHEWISQPNSPNLYWALTSLRTGQMSNRQGLLGELRLSRFGVEAFDHPESRNWTADQWLDSLSNDLAMIMQLPEANGESRIAVSAFLIRDYPISKEYLLANGWDAETIDQMPVAQVVCIHVAERLTQIVDGWTKWSLLSPDEMRQAVGGELGRAARRTLPGRDTNSQLFRELSLIGSFTGSVLPAVEMAYEAEVRVETQLQMLRTIEAIRMHIAETGSIPESLDQIKVVPVPNDPQTDKPFEYRITETHVELVAPDVLYSGKLGIVYRFTR